jgi:hypothetical protein
MNLDPSKDIVSLLESTTSNRSVQFHWNLEGNWVVYKFVLGDAFSIHIGSLQYYNNHTYSDDRATVRNLWNALVNDHGWVKA